MKADLLIKDGVIIPAQELIITTSRAGGPGGQHVNKTSTRITVRWNVTSSNALTDEQKARIMEKLRSQITTEGDIIVHNSSSRSQLHNKKAAMHELAHKLRKALHIQKKRIKTGVSHATKEARLREKRSRSEVKKMRGKKFEE